MLLTKSVGAIAFTFEPLLNDLGGLILNNTQRESKGIP